MTKPSVLAGWALFLFLLLLSVYSFIANLAASSSSCTLVYLVHGLFNTLIFSGSAWLLNRLSLYKNYTQQHRKKLSVAYLPLLFVGSVAAAILVFLLYVLPIVPLTGEFRGIFELYPTNCPLTEKRLLPAIFLLALLPSAAEEILLRGVFFSLYERRGTIAAILLSALAGALLTPSPWLLLPLFVSGLFCAFLLHVTDSIYASVIGRCIIRVFIVLMTLAFTHCTADTIRHYSIALLICLFFLLAFWSFCILKKLTQDELLPRFRRASGTLGHNLTAAVSNTGFLSFVLLFLLRIIVWFLLSVIS